MWNPRAPSSSLSCRAAPFTFEALATMMTAPSVISGSVVVVVVLVVDVVDVVVVVLVVVVAGMVVVVVLVEVVVVVVVGGMIAGPKVHPTSPAANAIEATPNVARLTIRPSCLLATPRTSRPSGPRSIPRGGGV
jgi:hypothetical protein